MLSDPYRATSVNEAILFHGCLPPAVPSICQGGFDPRRGGEQAGDRFGYATYFTPTASKADMYTESSLNKLQNATSERKMLVARTLLGQSFRTTRSMRGVL